MVSLWLICKNTTQPFVTNLIIMMILSCIGAVLTVYSNMHIDDPPPEGYYFILLQGTAGWMRDGLFNISHWIFAY